MLAVVAGQQVVDADDRVAAIEQRLGQMRSDEAGGAGDDDSGHVVATSFQLPASSSAARLACLRCCQMSAGSGGDAASTPAARR